MHYALYTTYTVCAQSVPERAICVYSGGVSVWTREHAVGRGGGGSAESRGCGDGDLAACGEAGDDVVATGVGGGWSR